MLLPRRPRLAANVSLREGDIAGADWVAGKAVEGADGLSTNVVEDLLARLDGRFSLEEILSKYSAGQRPSVVALLGALDDAGAIADDEPVSYVSGYETILELEEFVQARCRNTIYKNPFWTTCLSATDTGDLELGLATGMVIENWHFLHRESYFDAPVLSYVPNTAVRLLMNEFFEEEYGHDELLLQSLNAVGITREEMADAIPLPETMALCNALAFWAHTDPLFFFTTLGLLEGQGMTQDSFIDACERCQLDEAFIRPLRAHANINLKAAHGNLSRAILREIRIVDRRTFERLKRQTPLFVDLYDDFYTGVWRHYGCASGGLLRLVAALEDG